MTILPPAPPMTVEEMVIQTLESGVYDAENTFDDIRIFAETHNLELCISCDEQGELVYHLRMKMRR